MSEDKRRERERTAALVKADDDPAADAEAAVSADFDALRWFDLPARCLS